MSDEEQVSMMSLQQLLQPPVDSLVSVRRQMATVRMAAYAVNELTVGDLVETGVFRGGTAVLMARVLHNLSAHRLLWACDSFQGLPRAQAQDDNRHGCLETRTPPRRSCNRGRLGFFRAPRDTLERALRSEGLAHHVRIVPGWFHESLPPRGLRAISMLRIDGDSFNGTYEALQRLYPLVVYGGIVYVDDAGSFRGATMAMESYFRNKPPNAKRIREAEGWYEAMWWRKGIARDALTF